MFFQQIDRLKILILKDHRWAIFLMGFFTVFLPCGQSLFVFSACAVYGQAFEGAINGFIFAFLTTPSLVLAMRLRSFFNNHKRAYPALMGLSLWYVALFSFLRAFADLGWVDHYVLNPSWPKHYRLFLY